MGYQADTDHLATSTLVFQKFRKIMYTSLILGVLRSTPPQSKPLITYSIAYLVHLVDFEGPLNKATKRAMVSYEYMRHSNHPTVDSICYRMFWEPREPHSRHL